MMIALWMRIFFDDLFSGFLVLREILTEESQIEMLENAMKIVQSFANSLHCEGEERIGDNI